VFPEIDTAARSYSRVRRVGRMVLRHWIWETVVAGIAAGIVASVSGANPLPTITTFGLALFFIVLVYGGRAAIEENKLTELRRLSAEGWQLLHRDDLTLERRNYGAEEISQAVEKWIEDYNGYADRLTHATQKWLSRHDCEKIKWSNPRYPQTFPAGLYPNNHSDEHNVSLGALAGQLGALDNAISKRL